MNGATNYSGTWYAVNGSTVTMGLSAQPVNGTPNYSIQGFVHSTSLTLTSGPVTGTYGSTPIFWDLTMSGTNASVTGSASLLMQDSSSPTSQEATVSWSQAIVFNAAGHP